MLIYIHHQGTLRHELLTQPVLAAGLGLNPIRPKLLHGVREGARASALALVLAPELTKVQPGLPARYLSDLTDGALPYTIRPSQKSFACGVGGVVGAATGRGDSGLQSHVRELGYIGMRASLQSCESEQPRSRHRP